MLQAHIDRRTGVLGTVSLPILLIIVLMICALCLDSWHLSLARTELQNAVDAAALAGARDLDRSAELVVRSALAVAAENSADGRAVKNDADTTVTVTILPSDAQKPGKLRIDAAMNVRHSLARLFGRKSDFVYATAVAGGFGALTEVRPNQLFPLAISINSIPHNSQMIERPLNVCDCGEGLRLFIHNQQVRNASFTTFDKSAKDLEYLKDAIKVALEGGQQGTIPGLKTGDQINLNLGATGQRQLSDPALLEALNAGPVLNLPVISGDPQYSKTATVVGFVGFKVREVSLASPGGPVSSISGTIVRSSVMGKTGELAFKGDERSNQGMRQISMCGVKLLPTR